MAAPIRVGGLDAEEAEDLVQALAARGLIGHPIEAGKAWDVEVREAHEETERLFEDVRASLEVWLDEHGRPSAKVIVEGELHTIEARPGLDAALRRRVRGAPRARPR